LQVINFGHSIEIWEAYAHNQYTQHVLPAYDARGCMGHHIPTTVTIEPRRGESKFHIAVMQDPTFKHLVCTVQMQDIIEPMKLHGFWTMYTWEKQATKEQM